MNSEVYSVHGSESYKVQDQAASSGEAHASEGHAELTRDIIEYLTSGLSSSSYETVVTLD